MVADNPNCPPPSPKKKTVFLIELVLKGQENEGKHFYFSVDWDGAGSWWVNWTEDPYRAIQFAREDDASKMNSSLLFNTDSKISKVSAPAEK